MLSEYEPRTIHLKLRQNYFFPPSYLKLGRLGVCCALICFPEIQKSLFTLNIQMHCFWFKYVLNLTEGISRSIFHSSMCD